MESNKSPEVFAFTEKTTRILKEIKFSAENFGDLSLEQAFCVLRTKETVQDSIGVIEEIFGQKLSKEKVLELIQSTTENAPKHCV